MLFAVLRVMTTCNLLLDTDVSYEFVIAILIIDSYPEDEGGMFHKITQNHSPEDYSRHFTVVRTSQLTPSRRRSRTNLITSPLRVYSSPADLPGTPGLALCVPTLVGCISSTSLLGNHTWPHFDIGEPCPSPTPVLAWGTVTFTAGRVFVAKFPFNGAICCLQLEFPLSVL
jgi:hypothetical protein